MPPLGVSRVRQSLFHNLLSLGWAAGAPCLFSSNTGGGVRAWGPVNNPTAHALASWRCALWGRPAVFLGGPSCFCEGCPGPALSLRQRSVFEAGGRGPLPVCLGRRGCGRGNPRPTQQRTLLRGGFLRCQGGTTAPGWGGGRLVPL